MENRKIWGILFAPVFLFLIFSSLFAETTEDEYVPLETAIIQIMNKQAGKTQTVMVPVGQSTKFDKLEILVQKCLGTNEFMPENYYMFAEIRKSGRDIFSGWMIKSEPGKNPLQDPDNDVWLVKCE